MNLKTKVVLALFLNTCCVFNLTAMISSNEKEGKEKKPYIVKLGKTFQVLTSKEEKALGEKYEETYMKESDYKQDSEKKSYSSYSDQFGESKYETGENYYKNVGEILDKNYNEIEKQAGSDFDFIRVHAGWHENDQDGRHITISFAKNISNEIKEIEQRIRIHLDETGIKKKK